MKYGVGFQYFPKNAKRPSDDGDTVSIVADDTSGNLVLPQVGDYVEINNSADGGKRTSFSGKVRSRLFNYVRASDDEIYCGINIVVEESDDDWGRLIKE